MATHGTAGDKKALARENGQALQRRLPFLKHAKLPSAPPAQHTAWHFALPPTARMHAALPFAPYCRTHMRTRNALRAACRPPT